ncbi:hypothetical protein EP073_04510 [Geovibrio thiophilus]|uniref:Uncharacterized protein n=1 Tax=Geovibrio thiophilus TaxID=139438 RepID=A0A3R5YYP6_9BACT|nr:hypothetical protein [Geovibrio thiophilus]QAR32695.1 hypothetical protein EP073_04510 [Geovibrio thiophilus]
MSNNKIKPTFLLSKAVIAPKEPCTEYKNNIIYTEQNYLNLISLVTQSKTFVAPSDDDPDPEAEFCF